jgi:uncharacterized protein (TIGR03083 family)
MPARPRPVALHQALPAFLSQSDRLLPWADALTPEQLAAPSVLAAWTVGDLVFHLARSAGMVAETVAQPASGAPQSIAAYVSNYAGGAEVIAERSRGKGTSDPAGELRARTMEALEALDGVDGDAVIMGRRGPIRIADMLATRVLELVTHSLDLGAPVQTDALSFGCRILVGILAEREPGHAVELRVPPYAAAQVLTGTRHRRGTPPAVVEIAPPDWIRLATGRVSWADAVADGRIRASGERSDLSAYLPVLS